MKPSDFVIVTDPTPGQIAFLEDRLYEFNVAATGIDNGEYLAIFVRDANDAIVAGICGVTWGGVCEIRQLWVDSSRRGSGLGSGLLQAIDAPGKDDRLRAVQALIDGWSASPTAIAGVLALLAPAHIESMSAPGRYNALFYLTRTAPLAWDDNLAATAGEMIQRARPRRDMGRDSQDELGRLERLLAAAKAGAAAGPAN